MTPRPRIGPRGKLGGVDPEYLLKAGLLAARYASSPADLVIDGGRRLRYAPKVGRPGLAESFIPVWGSGREAVADFQDGKYGEAAFNAGLAISDVVPVLAAAKAGRAVFKIAIKVPHARKNLLALTKPAVSHDMTRRHLTDVNLYKKGQDELHHAVGRKYKGDYVRDWRNHYLWEKPLKKETHRRIHGKWGGKPRYDIVRRTWIGSPEWAQGLVVGAGTGAVNGGQISRPSRASPVKSPGR